MTGPQRRKTVLTGHAEDLAKVVPRIASRSAEVALVNEDASRTDVPKATDVVVFVMSLKAFYSTQLHSVFVYGCDRVRARERYLLAMGDVDLSNSHSRRSCICPASPSESSRACCKARVNQSVKHLFHIRKVKARSEIARRHGTRN